MVKEQFPYQDLETRSIKGERWSAIPGFEEYYIISSLGRVKSLERERLMYYGGIMLMKERILKIQCRKYRNTTVNDDIYSLITTLSLDGVQYSFSVARLVYHEFVAPFDLDDRSIFISPKDGDGRNLHFKNLTRTTISRLRNSSFEKGRAIARNKKAVSQFDTDGRLINQYDSHSIAAKTNGYCDRAISGNALNNNALFGGYVWQPGRGTVMKRDKLVRKAEGGTNIPLMQRLRLTDEHPQLNPILNLSLKNMEKER